MRRKIFAWVGGALALGALAWSAPAAEIGAGRSANLVGQIAGLALLGLAAIAIALVFHAAMSAPPRPRAKPLQRREFRSGFTPAHAIERQRRRSADQDQSVIAFRGAVAERGDGAAEIARLRRLLARRAAALRGYETD